MQKLIKEIAFGAIHKFLQNDNGFVELQVRRGPTQGLKMSLDLVQRKESAYWLGKYDHNIFAALRDVVKPGWTCWDCGVYIGLYSCFLARQVGSGGQVVGFEPDQNNLLRAKKNVDLNGLSNVTIMNYAVGGPRGHVDFVVSGNTNSHLRGVWLGNTIDDYKEIEVTKSVVKVSCYSLDQLIAMDDIPKPQLVKLDIEGAELEALQNLDQLCTTLRPIILLELHNPQCDAMAWDFSQKYRYSLYSFYHKRMIDKKADTCGTLLCKPL